MTLHGVDYIEIHIWNRKLYLRKAEPTQDVDHSDNFHSLLLYFYIKHQKHFFNLRQCDFWFFFSLSLLLLLIDGMLLT